MKIHKSEIAPKLKQLRGFIAQRNNITATQGILFHNSTLIASDLELAVSTPIAAPINDESFIITPSAIDFIMNLPNEEITIEPKNGKLNIKCGKAHASFGTEPADSFPTSDIFGLEEMEASYECEAETMMSALSCVAFACDNGKLASRPIYSGVKLQTKDKRLNIVASDGQRMAWCNFDCNAKIDISIHKKHLQKIMSLGLTGMMKLYIIENKKAVFRTEKYTVYSSLLMGDYTDYESIFRKAANVADYAEADTKAAIDILNRAIICGEKNRPTELVFEQNSLTVRAKSGSADFSEVLPIEMGRRKDVTIGINAVYLLEALKAAESSTVEIRVGGATSPILIRTEKLEQLILPIRLR